MCRAMNRSLANVLFGAVGAVVKGPAAGVEKRVTAWTPEDAAICLSSAAHVAIVPGYGMAVAQAQHAVKELADLLDKQGVDVKFGIHEVAGRMPGHMNVLLAEAEVPYEKLLDREAINAEMDRTDAVIVLGANDVVNPVARHDKASPIYGMPIIDVDKARTVMVCKRSLNPGFAGVDNELFYLPNTVMIFGDGKATITAIVAALKQE
jgi:NAD(P) transhydrogenase subunit beta